MYADTLSFVGCIQPEAQISFISMKYVNCVHFIRRALGFVFKTYYRAASNSPLWHIKKSVTFTEASIHCSLTSDYTSQLVPTCKQLFGFLSWSWLFPGGVAHRVC